MQIPIFAGDKKNYQLEGIVPRLHRFCTCNRRVQVTATSAVPLREALKVIDSLGHSAAAYEAAKDRLERKFGGKRRQIALHFEELEEFPQIRQGHTKDIEEFADLLDIAIINLYEAG